MLIVNNLTIKPMALASSLTFRHERLTFTEQVRRYLRARCTCLHSFLSFTPVEVHTNACIMTLEFIHCCHVWLFIVLLLENRMRETV